MAYLMPNFQCFRFVPLAVATVLEVGLGLPDSYLSLSSDKLPFMAQKCRAKEATLNGARTKAKIHSSLRHSLAIEQIFNVHQKTESRTSVVRREEIYTYSETGDRGIYIYI